MKLISRLTTALMCSVITVGFGISSGNAETAIDTLGTKELLPKLVQFNSTLEPNKNKQNAVKQSSQQIVGNWVGTRSDGIELSLYLSSTGSFFLMYTEPERNWRYNSGSWSINDNRLSLKDNHTNKIINNSVINWISNNEFVTDGVKFRQIENEQLDSLNQNVIGRWEILNSVAGVGVREGVSSTIIEFRPDETFKYQRLEAFLGLGGYKETNIAGTWEWWGDVLYIINNDRNDRGRKQGMVGRVHWISPNKFEYIQPGNKRLLFERTNAQFRQVGNGN